MNDNGWTPERHRMVEAAETEVQAASLALDAATDRYREALDALTEAISPGVAKKARVI